jgi:hypothetical protein
MGRTWYYVVCSRCNKVIGPYYNKVETFYIHQQHSVEVVAAGLPQDVLSFLIRRNYKIGSDAKIVLEQPQQPSHPRWMLPQ